MEEKTTCPKCGYMMNGTTCSVCGYTLENRNKESNKYYEEITGTEIYDQPVRSFFYTLIAALISFAISFKIGDYLIDITKNYYPEYDCTIAQCFVVLAITLISFSVTNYATYKTRLGKEAKKFGVYYKAGLVDIKKNEEEGYGKIITFRISTEDGSKNVIYHYRFKLGPFYTKRSFELYLYNDYIYVEDIFRTKDYYSKDRYR